MLKDFIGKNVKITVAFGAGLAGAGSMPAIYTGKLLKCDDNYCQLEVSEANMATAMGGFGKTLSYTSLNTTGITILNNKFIASVSEA